MFAGMKKYGVPLQAVLIALFLLGMLGVYVAILSSTSPLPTVQEATEQILQEHPECQD